LLKSWDKYFYLQDSDKISKELIKKGSVTLPGKQILASFDKIVQGISKRYSENIPDVFSDKEGNLSKASIEIDLEKPGYLSSSKSITVKIGETHTVQGKIEDDSVYISTIASGDDSPPKFLIEGIVNVLIGRLVLAGYFPRPFISTSEVLGISLFYKELDAAKSVLVEELQRLKKDEGYKNGINPFELVEKMSSRYAAPIKDNIRFTRDIGEIQKIGTSTDSKHLVDKLKFMMDGYFRKVDKGEIRFISKARKKRRFDIPLYLGSTAARELTILFFFLGHIAEEGMILMIDEPESHLSPANQIEIARLLALCVNAGLKVFITTHSDFLIKEFNNLIMLSQDFKGKKDFLKKNSGIYSERDFLKPESVNAYICKDGTLKKCFVDKKGMDINSFDETIDEINRISDELDFLTDD
jgi:predicted ATPase